MKTLIIYSDTESNLKFLVVDGDYSKFHGIVINGNDHEYIPEFLEFAFKEDGNFKHEWSEDISLIENKKWDKVAICTFLP